MIEQQSAGIVVYCIKDYEIQYLILHYISGHWDLAKGKLEEGETMLQAAHRELNEETSLSAEIIPGFEESLSYVFKERGKIIKKTVTFFVGRTNQQAVRLSREHQGYLWVPFEKAYSKLTYNNAKELLSHVDEFLKKKNEIAR
jgi:8-oxo-dGTP pyrophosphatase MutT (NUDIX family)